MKIDQKNCLLLLALTSAASQAHALGIRIADQSAFATARGNAFAATANDPSAIYYNPAGIAQLHGQQVQLGTYAVTLESQYTSPAGAETDTERDIQITPQLFYTAQIGNSPVTLGVGFYSPYGLALEWPDNSTFRAAEGSIEYLTLNPTIAWQAHPTFSIGAGITLNYADATLEQTILPAAFFPPGGRNKFSGDGMDVGFNAGLLWKPFEKHSFGLTYFSATKMNLKGDSSKSGADLAGIPSGSESAEAEFEFPQHIVAGWSYRPTPKWNLEVNVDWTDWDTLNTVTINQASGPASLPFNWDSSFFYEFGVTRYFDNNLHVSGGYIFSENSAPEASFNPIVPDSDRHIFSAGVGGQYKKFRWDAAYQFAYGPSRTVGNTTLVLPVGSSAAGKYEFFSHAIGLTVGYGF
jgi:long-chain fatty acid transport protein